MRFKKNNRPKFSYIIICLIPILLSDASFAADHYIRDGATGANNGSNWSDAWEDADDIVWKRGDTYFFADGSYTGAITFNTPENGSQWIYIVKATTGESRCTSVMGWQNSYGDGQAVFHNDILNRKGGLQFRTGYYVMDGVVGGGPDDWDGSSLAHGFKVTADSQAYTTPFHPKYLIQLGNFSTDDGADNFVFSHIELTAVDSMPETISSPDNMYGVFGIASNVALANQVQDSGVQNLTVSECYFHQCHLGMHLDSVVNVLIENCYFYDFIDEDGAGSIQSDGFKVYGANGFTVRYCLFHDTPGTGSCWFGAGDSDTGMADNSVDNVYIYGNVFITSPDKTAGNYNHTVGITGDATDTDSVDTFYVYNNTFINLNGLTANAGVRIGTDWGGISSVTDFKVFNNLFYDVQNDAVATQFFNGVTSRDSNWFYECRLANVLSDSILARGETNGQVGKSDPFLDWPNKHFSLTSATNPGVILPAPYNVDMFGNNRGADGVWDRGAIEFTGVPSPEPTAVISSPTNGQAFAYEKRTITLDASGSSDLDGTIVQWVWTDSLGDTLPDGKSTTATLSTGTHQITLTVRDNDNLSDTTSVQITVNEAPISSNTDVTLKSRAKLIENEGNTALDYSANNYDGTLVNNPVWEPGEGLKINGNQYIEISDLDTLELSTPMTFSTWVKLNSFNNWTKLLIKPHSSFASPWEMYALDLGSNGNTPRFVVTDGVVDGNAAVAASTQIINAHQWYHIVGTYDGSNIRLYLDGQLQATQAVNFAIGTNSMPLSIGGRMGVNTIDGNLSDIRIYNGCLSDEQVNTLFKQKRNDGLANSLNITDKSSPDFGSTIVKDSSGNDQNALLVENPEWGEAWAQEYFLQFNGNDQAIEVSCESLQPEAGTVALWVEQEQALSSQAQVLFGSIDGGNTILLYTDVNGHLGVSIGGITNVTDISLEPGAMQHVALTWNGTAYAVYLDGEQRAAGTFPGLTALAATADIANMGAGYRSSGYGFNGIVDDVQIYSRALSASEISALYYTVEVKENRQLAFLFNGKDEDGNPLTYTAQNLPAGASFDPARQELVWKPWYDQAGDHAVLFVSPDQSDQQTVTFSVGDVKVSDWYREFLRQNGKL